MFQLALISDTISVHPKHLLRPFPVIILQALQKKYSNKIISNLGLCISIYDVIEIKDPIVHIGEGRPFSKVTFRAIIFHPWPGQLLTGRVKSSSDKGISVSLGFFDDILIPSNFLPEISVLYLYKSLTSSDHSEMLWYWNYDGAKLYIETGALIRIRVMAEAFYEYPPLQKGIVTNSCLIEQMFSRKPDQPLSAIKDVTQEPLNETLQKPIYTIIGSIAEDGLGLISWWAG